MCAVVLDFPCLTTQLLCFARWFVVFSNILNRLCPISPHPSRQIIRVQA
jgi:hypothetical protein